MFNEFDYNSSSRKHLYVPSFRDSAGHILVADSQRKVALVFPDGTRPYPALDFRYGAIQAAGKGWFLVRESAFGSGRDWTNLVDRHNRPVSAALSITAIKPYLESHPGVPGAERLFSVWGHRRPDNKFIEAVLDDRGRLYLMPEE